FDKYLIVDSVEIAKEEYETYYNTKGGKKGRKKISKICDWMLMSTYKLMKNHASFSDKTKILTDNEAKFLLGYLKYLGLIEEDSKRDDVLNIRATVNNLRKYTLDFDWWNMPKSRFDDLDPRVQRIW
ncbi:hypothetical protein LJB97_04460, partial [Parabacteroides sp. OttesenSCG-928-O15]|nr:hypothetical protein [Parabacteroides sp. OttesenSCG-928-O15]